MSSRATSGLTRERRVDDLVAAGDLGHDLDVGLELEQARERAADHPLVLGDQDPDHWVAGETGCSPRAEPGCAAAGDAESRPDDAAGPAPETGSEPGPTPPDESRARATGPPRRGRAQPRPARAARRAHARYDRRRRSVAEPTPASGGSSGSPPSSITSTAASASPAADPDRALAGAAVADHVGRSLAHRPREHGLDGGGERDLGRVDVGLDPGGGERHPRARELAVERRLAVAADREAHLAQRLAGDLLDLPHLGRGLLGATRKQPARRARP